MMVLSERSDSYQGKKGQVNQQLLTCVDMSDGGERVNQMFEYALSDIEKASHAGKLEGKLITLGMREIKPFGSVLRVRGGIVALPEVKK